MSVESISIASENIYSDCDEYESSSWNGRSVTVESASNSELVGRIVLCGERCHGEVSADFSVGTDNNKSADVEVEIESEDGNVSGYVGGEVNQGKEGNTHAEIKGGVTIKF